MALVWFLNFCECSDRMALCDDKSTVLVVLLVNIEGDRMEKSPEIGIFPVEGG